MIDARRKFSYVPQLMCFTENVTEIPFHHNARHGEYILRIPAYVLDLNVEVA
jgi:hypothetical protein